MSNLWINWRILWWRIQIGPDRPWVRFCWHCQVHRSSGCVFCDLDLMPDYDDDDGVLFHDLPNGQRVRCGLQP